MNNKFEKYEKFVLDGGCPSKAHEEADVTVPVIVRAYGELGDVHLKCMGPAVITRNSTDTPGRPDAVSKFTIRQKLRVEIPVIFGAETEIGEAHIDYKFDNDKDNNDDDDKCKCSK